MPKGAVPSPLPADASANMGVGPFVAALAAASAVRGQANFARPLPARDTADRRKRERERRR